MGQCEEHNTELEGRKHIREGKKFLGNWAGKGLFPCRGHCLGKSPEGSDIWFLDTALFKENPGQEQETKWSK